MAAIEYSVSGRTFPNQFLAGKPFRFRNCFPVNSMRPLHLFNARTYSEFPGHAHRITVGTKDKLLRLRNQAICAGGHALIGKPVIADLRPIYQFVLDARCRSIVLIVDMGILYCDRLFSSP